MGSDKTPIQRLSGKFSLSRSGETRRVQVAPSNPSVPTDGGADPSGLRSSGTRRSGEFRRPPPSNLSAPTIGDDEPSGLRTSGIRSSGEFRRPQPSNLSAPTITSDDTSGLHRSGEFRRPPSSLSAPTVTGDDSAGLGSSLAAGPGLKPSGDSRRLPPHPEFAETADALGMAARSQDSLERTIDADSADVSDDSVVSVRGEELLPLRDWDLYRITGLVGVGGMGTVYRAIDRRLNRSVAIKLLYVSVQPELGERQRHRFIREAQAQARIEHPHVCKIYEVGEVDGQPYIAMQLIEGQPLATYYTAMSREQKVRLMQQVADAIHAAHHLGIIHRDIKPGNIMVERRPDGAYWPYVMDFGLARQVDSDGQTAAGTIEGTPAFMSPEQARGDVVQVDARTDVYGLGATLYALLAGRPPFVGPSTEALVDVLLHAPPALRSIDPNIPADLETIVGKCMEKEPVDRYPSALALAADLTRYLDGDPISVRPPTTVDQLRRWISRHRLAVAMIALLSVVCVGSIGVGLRARWAAQAQAELAQQLGQNIKDMDLFMRYAYLLPLHDIAREQAVVRERMSRLSALRLRERDNVLLHYALGRGHLVLREYAEAQRLLEEAWQGGFQTPDLRLALGQVLTERYRRGVEQARLSGNWQQAATVENELRGRYLTPGLGHLEAALSASESPAYWAGLVAFYRGDYARAEQLAQQAKKASPWLPEPLRLQGDIDQLQGIALLQAGSPSQARTHLTRASASHHAAATIAGSDAALHTAEAIDWLYLMQLDAHDGKPLEDALAHAAAVAERATLANPAQTPLHSLRVHIYWQYVSLSQNIIPIGELPKSYFDILSAAVPIAQKAIDADINSPVAYRLLATALTTACAQRQLRTPCSSADMAHAVSIARRGRDLQNQPGGPAFAAAPARGGSYDTLLSLTLTTQYANQLLLGEEAGATLLDAQMAISHALTSPDVSIIDYLTAVRLSAWQSQAQLTQGRDPAKTLLGGLQYADAGLRLQPNQPLLHVARSLLHTTWGQWKAAAPDAATHWPLAIAAAERAIALSPGRPEPHEALAHALRHAAAWEITGKQNAASHRRVAAALARGLSACETALQLAPGRVPLLATKGALLLLRARTEKKPKQRRETAGLAAAALGQAIEPNGSGILAFELRPLLATARALASDARPAVTEP